MSDDDFLRYRFYLKEPLTEEALRSIYTDIREKVPKIRFDPDIKMMASYSYDPTCVLGERARIIRDPYLHYEDYLIINITHRGLSRDNLRHMDGTLHPVWGERQLDVVFITTTRETFDVLVGHDPQLGHELMPLVSSVAGHSRAFYGIYSSAEEWPIVHVPPGESLRDVEVEAEAIGQVMTGWGSFYIDNQLAQDIGMDKINEFGAFIDHSNGEGYFIERHGIPLYGSGMENDAIIRRTKDRIFYESMLPKIRPRFRLEYELDTNPPRFPR